jgi:hypothetical protein
MILQVSPIKNKECARKCEIAAVLDKCHFLSDGHCKAKRRGRAMAREGN